MDYPYYTYVRSLSDDESEDSNKQDNEAEEYKFEGFEIETNVKVTLNAVNKIKAS
ncbi:MAG TPA: hypothetical protein VM802_03930 [Chitinophaga sp.]|uniref:hypothetical protein n=1 Tax=Chitinophaga sp. TaxID=1869181 RepID=UPI002C603286|nr:hypothetical protein [Chitinophaga sp.]HVI43985.1 hypothetical protein [Chitinophaga sp.]